MEHPSLAEHASRFALDGPVTAVEPLGNGNVNDTYRVSTGSGTTYVLQRINTAVFQRPDLVMANLAALGAHVTSQPSGEARWEVPQAIALRDGSGNWLSTETGAWRVLSYVSDAETFDTVQGPQHAHEVGRALGTFHRLIHDLPSERLADTLEGFHITPLYLAAYRQTLADSARQNCADSEWCQGFVAEREALAGVLETAKARGELQLRPIHGDPKVNNVMLCRRSGRAVALVDLDTVKPGLIHYDIGDCLRSGCNPLGEDTLEPHAVRFELELCEAMLSGYLSEGRQILSNNDIAHLYNAIRLIPFELGLRFLSDHLAGNRYFKVRHPRHNLDRARVQFQLVRSIEDQHEAIETLIHRLLSS